MCKMQVSKALAVSYKQWLESLAAELITPQLEEFLRTVFVNKILKAVRVYLFVRTRVEFAVME